MRNALRTYLDKSLKKGKNGNSKDGLTDDDPKEKYC